MNLLRAVNDGFVAVGHPEVKPGILEKQLLLDLRFGLDQYINLRPVKLFPGVETPLTVGPLGLDGDALDLAFVVAVAHGAVFRRFRHETRQRILDAGRDGRHPGVIQARVSRITLRLAKPVRYSSRKCCNRRPGMSTP